MTKREHRIAPTSTETERRLAIWLLPSAFHPHKGGVEELTLQLAQEMSRRGHEALVVTNRHPLHLPRLELVEGIQVVRLAFTAPRAAVVPTVRFPFEYARTLSTLLRIRPRPDILHVQCASVQLAPALGFSALRRTPLVVTTQGEVEMDQSALFKRSVFARRVFAAAGRRASAVSACSNWAAEAAARVAPAYAGAAIIPNGIDPAQWPVTGRPSAPIVAAWGRLVTQKGFDLLLAAWPAVRQALPSAQLFLGGDGPERKRLEASSSEGVRFLGPLDRQDVRALISQSRVVVVPSRVEPFGIVALEAMASGRPVVWSNRGGLAEATGGLGWGVDPTDGAALSRAIVEGLLSDGDAERYSEHAGKFSWSEIGERYLRVYRDVLHARSGRPGAG